MGYSQILTVGKQDLQVDLVLMRLVDMTFSRVFSDPHLGIQGLQMDLVLMRLVDMTFSRVF